MSAREALGAALLGDPAVSGAAIETEISARLAALGDERAWDDDDPRALYAFLLKMARRELHFGAPPEPEARREALAAHLAERPREEVDHAQLFIDLDSTLRRARLVLPHLHGGSCLAVGDDDALSLALLELGAEVTAVDIDVTLLRFLEARAGAMGRTLRTRLVDVHEDEPAPELLDAFSVVVTDPPRSFDEALAFLAFSARCLAPRADSRLFYADHADWNPELDQVLAALPGLGLELVTTHPSAARYPLTPRWVPDLPARARALGLEEGTLRALIAAVPAHSDLFELRPRVRPT